MLRQFILQDDHVARARTVTHKMSRIRNELPCLTPDLKCHCRRKHRLYDKAKKTGKKEQKQQYKEAQKSFQTELKKSHWLYINNILCTSLEEGNSTPINKYVRSKREDQAGVSSLKEDGVLHTSPAKISEIVAKQFRLVFTNDKDDPFSETRIQGPSYHPTGELAIRDEGVEKLHARIDPNKAAGPDEIPCRRSTQ